MDLKGTNLQHRTEWKGERFIVWIYWDLYEAWRDIRFIVQNLLIFGGRYGKKFDLISFDVLISLKDTIRTTIYYL